LRNNREVFVVTMTSNNRPSVLITVHNAKENLSSEEMKKMKMKERSKINRKKKKNEAIARYIKKNGYNTKKLSALDIKKLVQENQKNKKETLEAIGRFNLIGFEDLTKDEAKKKKMKERSKAHRKRKAERKRENPLFD